MMKIVFTSLQRMKALLALLALLALIACQPQVAGGGVEGSGTGEDDSIYIAGYAQKGPFITGAKVLVQPLLADATNDGAVRASEIQGDLGHFKVNLAKYSPLAINVKGRAYNEIENRLTGELSLDALVNWQDARQTVFVNLLTHLSFARIKVLMQAGQSSQESIAQAERELRASISEFMNIRLSAGVEAKAFSELSLYNYAATDADNNAYLLYVSASIYQAAITAAENSQLDVDESLFVLLTSLSVDLAEDGRWDKEAGLLTRLTQARRDVNMTQVKANLEQYSQATLGELLEVPDYSVLLPATPDNMTSTVSTASLTGNELTATVTLTWQAVDTAERYDVAYMTQAEYKNLLAGENVSDADFYAAAQQLTVSTTTATLNVRDDLYVWRVRARNAYAQESPWSPIQRLNKGMFYVRFVSQSDMGNNATIQEVTVQKLVALGRDYVVAGYVGEHPNNRLFLAKVNRQGELLWKRVFTEIAPTWVHTLTVVTQETGQGNGQDSSSNVVQVSFDSGYVNNGASEARCVRMHMMALNSQNGETLVSIDGVNNYRNGQCSPALLDIGREFSLGGDTDMIYTFNPHNTIMLAQHDSPAFSETRSVTFERVTASNGGRESFTVSLPIPATRGNFPSVETLKLVGIIPMSNRTGALDEQARKVLLELRHSEKIDEEADNEAYQLLGQSYYYLVKLNAEGRYEYVQHVQEEYQWDDWNIHKFVNAHGDFVLIRYNETASEEEVRVYNDELDLLFSQTTDSNLTLPVVRKNTAATTEGFTLIRDVSGSRNPRDSLQELTIYDADYNNAIYEHHFTGDEVMGHFKSLISDKPSAGLTVLSSFFDPAGLRTDYNTLCNYSSTWQRLSEPTMVNIY